MKRFAILLLDIGVLYLSLAFTLLIRYGDNFKYQYGIHHIPFIFIFFIWIFIFYIDNLYETKYLKNNAQFFSELFRSIAISSAISAMSFYLIPLYGITPKTNLVIFIAIFTILELINRSVSNMIFQKNFKKPTLIVGLNSQSLELATFLRDNPQLGYEIKYVIDASADTLIRADEEFEKFGIIQGISNIENVINREKINTIVVSPEAYQISEIINIFYKALENKISFFNLSSFFEKLTGRVPLGAINQIWFLENLSEGRKKGYELAKRIFDIVFSIVIGIITLIFYPLIILAIKVSSRGPVFYKQKRVGQHGKIFEMIKFRTMRNDAEIAGAVWAKINDPRITSVGKFLRKSRIDELPQILNILIGEMSFVGPRAERPEFHGQLQSGIPFYEERYLIKPGLTGWAQINYRYVASVKDTEEKLKYDLYYIKNRSLILDLGIILKTISISLRQTGR